MTQSSQDFVVLVGVDYSETGDLAFERALRFCQPEPQATLHVVNVATMVLAAGDVEQALIVDPRQRSAEVEARLHSYVQQRLAHYRALGLAAPSRVVNHVRWEVPAEEIAQLAADLEADLVVVGTHGRRGLSRVLLGSVAEATVRHAPCPVFVVRPKGVTQLPAIEPPCPACLAARKASGGGSYWCEQHSQRHGQRHTYYSSDRISADGTMPLLLRS